VSNPDHTPCSVNMSARLLAAVLLLALASRANAQSRAAAPSPIGIFRGTSLCLVRPSPCNDERTVYYITATKTADSVSMDARKIVNGAEEEMGILPCRFAPADRKLTCGIGRGTWLFTVSTDSLVGELRVENNVKFRDVRAARAQK
jgi:hypothetical protein